jgi:hypothetical protein
MKFTGVKAEGRTGEESDFCTFDSGDINFIVMANPTKHSDKQPLFITNSGRYYQIGTLDGLAIILEKLGFTKLDSINVVNLSNIVSIHEDLSFVHAYFENGSYTSISRKNLHKVSHIPRKTI